MNNCSLYSHLLLLLGDTDCYVALISGLEIGTSKDIHPIAASLLVDYLAGRIGDAKVLR